MVQCNNDLGDTDRDTETDRGREYKQEPTAEKRKHLTNQEVQEDFTEIFQLSLKR